MRGTSYQSVFVFAQNLSEVLFAKHNDIFLIDYFVRHDGVEAQKAKEENTG